MILYAQTTDPPWWAFVLFFVALLVIALVARKCDADDARRILAHDGAARGLGLLGISFGLGLAYLLVYAPISEALAGGRRILVHRGAVGVSGIFVYFGLVLLLTGRHSRNFLAVDQSRKKTLLQWTVIIVGMAICLALEVGFDWFLRRQGYTAFG